MSTIGTVLLTINLTLPGSYMYLIYIYIYIYLKIYTADMSSTGAWSSNQGPQLSPPTRMSMTSSLSLTFKDVQTTPKSLSSYCPA